MDNYKYYINSVEVNPIGIDKLAIVHSKNGGDVYFESKLNNSITFTKSDYLIFKADYDLNSYCERYEFAIEQKCNHVYEVIYLGVFILMDGEFDFTRCTYKVAISNEDKYSCLKLNEDKEVNIYGGPIKYEITSGAITYDNAIKLVDAINVLKRDCDDVGDLVSDFFTNSVNPVTGQTSYTNNLYLIQQSDAKRPTDLIPASNWKTTYNNLIKAIENYFNVRHYVNSDGNLAIEHISTIQKNLGLDLTSEPYATQIKDIRKIKFDTNNIYKYEKWSTDIMKNEDFVGLPIIYTDCAKVNGEYKTKSYELNEYQTDLGFVQTNPDAFSDDGFVLVACNGSNEIMNKIGILSSANTINGFLAISNLHNDFWKYDRIFINGNMNGSDQTFNSSQKIKKIDKLNIIKCCDVEFDPENQVTTSFGVADVVSASFYLNTNKLELELNV